MPPDRRDCCGDVDVRSSAWSCAGETAWKSHRCHRRCARCRADRAVPPADVASPHLRLQTFPSLRREAFRCATSLRWRQQRRQAASAVALPPALNSSHTIAQHLRCLTDPGDPLFLKKTKQPQAIGSGLVTSCFLGGLQLRNIFLDQQRISSVHTQPLVPSTSLILNRANTLALILIPTLPIFSLCSTSRFIRIGITHRRAPIHLGRRSLDPPLYWRSFGADSPLGLSRGLPPGHASPPGVQDTGGKGLLPADRPNQSTALQSRRPLGP